MKTLFPSLPENASLGDVFSAHPAGIDHLLRYHDVLLRGDSDLSVAERELIAAFVSGLNGCDFCLGAHTIHARAFGIDPSVLEALLSDVDSAPVADPLKPILRYVAKLTRTPTRLIQADAQAVYDAGWSEAALFQAIQTCTLFNFMNRILEGTGIGSYGETPAEVDETGLNRRRSATAYTDFGRSLGLDL